MLLLVFRYFKNFQFFLITATFPVLWLAMMSRGLLTLTAREAKSDTPGTVKKGHKVLS